MTSGNDNGWQDKASAVRPGELLNAANLQAYLKKTLPKLDGPLTVKQFPSGFSNLTYLIRVGETELVLRRPPFGANIKHAHDMGREFRILSRLSAIYPKVPQPRLYCGDDSIIGAPFYLMERLSGVILRPHMPPAMVPDPPLMGRIANALIDNLADLHAIDYEAADLGDLGRPEGYVTRQVTGWNKRYVQAKTDEIADMEHTAVWLADHIPPESSQSGAALIHNDYKYDNLVLDSADWTNIIAVLDWEMATIGDPLMDLGTTLGYWVEPDDPPELRALQFSPTTLPGNPTRDELIERYARKSGRDVSNLTFYYVFGLFKLAVIVQQIYYRYKKGYTQDPRFADLITAVKACGFMAVKAASNSHE
ncbi:MAG: phosphotransferase family protein [Candidatus Promineifilaceae bacterium]